MSLMLYTVISAPADKVSGKMQELLSISVYCLGEKVLNFKLWLEVTYFEGLSIMSYMHKETYLYTCAKPFVISLDEI